MALKNEAVVNHSSCLQRSRGFTGAEMRQLNGCRKTCLTRLSKSISGYLKNRKRSFSQFSSAQTLRQNCAGDYCKNCQGRLATNGLVNHVVQVNRDFCQRTVSSVRIHADSSPYSYRCSASCVSALDCLDKTSATCSAASLSSHIVTKKLPVLPCACPESFQHTHSQHFVSSKHCLNQTFDTSKHCLNQTFDSSKHCLNQTFDSSKHCLDQTFDTSKHCLNQTFDMFGCAWTHLTDIVKTCDITHYHKIEPAQPCQQDRDTCNQRQSLTVSEAHRLMTASSVHNIASHAQEQDHVARVGRVASWAVHFDKLLQDPLGIDVFTEFLEKEFSDENIRFWKACEQFRGLTSQSQIKTQAKDIYKKYLSENAKEPINVDNTARLYTEQLLDHPKAVMFDVAQHQIFELMRQDSYPRFLKSDLYKNKVVKQLADGQHKLDKLLENKCVKKQNTGKENGGKRRRSILPWKLYMKSGKDDDLTKKVIAGTSSDQQLNANTPCTTATGVGIDLSTMRKEVFHQRQNHGCQERLVKFCRIIMPDGSTTVVCAKSGQTCHSVLSKLCEKRSISINSVDVVLLGSDKLVDLEDDISILGSREIVLEKRTVFYLQLPDGNFVERKAKPNLSIRHVLKPLLEDLGYSIDSLAICVTPSSEMIDLEMPVSRLDKQRVVVIPDTANSQKRKKHFGLFRASEKKVIVNRRHQPGQDDLGCS